MTKLLLEIGTEEIPAAFIPPALQQLKNNAAKMLTEARLTYKNINTYATPRRLTLMVNELSVNQPNLTEEIKGPPARIAYDDDGNLTKAGLGFAKKLKLDPQNLIKKELKGQEYIYAIKKTQGKPAKEIIPQLLVTLISKLNFPKPMRWGSNSIKFARPIRWLVALIDDELVQIEYANVKSGFYSRSHRFLGKGSIKIDNASNYLNILKDNYVIADMNERKDLILNQIKEIENNKGVKVLVDEDLLTEITCLVEYPTAFLGSFNNEYLKMPEEAIITPMREHQRYFPVRYSDNSLADYFVGVRNGVIEHIQTVISGNEKVLAARLADARFFFEEDKKNSLEFYMNKLKTVVFQEQLGTIYEKSLRIIALSQFITEALKLNEQEAKQTIAAAKLCKADLATNMVYEFPELQGIMGEKYAKHEGYPVNVAKAIREHYLPQGADDDLPETTQGIVVAIADKIDTIVGCLAVGLKASGSQDPYGLRRQAAGICRIVIDNKISLSLKALVKAVVESLQHLNKISDCIYKDVNDLFVARLRHLLQTTKGFSYDVVDSVLTAEIDDIYGSYCKVSALSKIKKSKEFSSLITAFKRANNLSQKASKQKLDPSKFISEYETKLYDKFISLQNNYDKAVENKDYSTALSLFADLEQEINEFFDNVMVMDKNDQIKNNRLALLQQIVTMANRLADFTKVVVE